MPALRKKKAPQPPHPPPSPPPPEEKLLRLRLCINSTPSSGLVDISPAIAINLNDIPYDLQTYAGWHIFEQGICHIFNVKHGNHRPVVHRDDGTCARVILAEDLLDPGFDFNEIYLAHFERREEVFNA